MNTQENTNKASTELPEFKEFTYKSEISKGKIKSVSLNIEDLKTLAKMLQDNAIEAIKFYADDDKNFINIPEDKRNELRKYLPKQFGKLWIEITGTNDEFLAGDSLALLENNMPEISKIRFVISNAFTAFTKANLSDFFEIQFDFSTSELMDFSNAYLTSEKNNSFYYIQGTHSTWVKGVCKALTDFFKQRSTKRNWLHSKNTYDLLLYFTAFPVNLFSIYKLGENLKLLKYGLPPVIITGIYIWFFFIFLMIFRIFFNYAKWVYPSLELHLEKSKRFRQRKVFYTILVTIILGLIVNFIYDHL